MSAKETSTRLQVLNPVAVTRGEVECAPPAKRPVSLEGKTLGLIWNHKVNGDVALRRVGEVLQERVSGLQVRFYAGGPGPTDTALMEKAKEECDVAVGCTAD